ncbi:NAD(P)/FAD-dependent oxidoreductase [Kocuria sp. NPDC057446]|uniref:NAD(P)/FAD-dependent oxidoreductase n=1 Tax=Kocuria sp. NPDC057446 TaxID=3346137 RepID=UPI0036C684E3
MTSAPRDIVVVGAGPAGSLLALLCARAGRRVVLLEHSRFRRPRIGETVAPSIQQDLRAAGLWEDFLALAPLPSWGTESAWGSAEPATHSHVLSPYGCAWHVDRLSFDAWLADSAAREGAALLTGTTVRSCLWHGDRWTLELSSGGFFESWVVVDGTGRSARIGRMLGAERIPLDRLVAITVTADRTAEAGHLLIETVPDGWWYSAPLPSGRLVAMLMTDADLCRDGNLASRVVWRERLNTAPLTSRRLRGLPLRSGPTVHAATSQRLHRRDALPWLALGDAALAVDPASGSGIVRALRSAAAGATAVEACLDGAGTAPLEAYEHTQDTACTKYLLERAEIYATERRWSSPFWQRRRRSIPANMGS